ncbi:hypothetical protein SAMN05518801_101453 [Novosphingobium sp. CF614]|uniref:hypothetical protein n=1 Tax=Novosphingobium sp. CF614 TaxID=1884364 RepID=UPI0008ED3BFC|nr:hypothetical protein [Novosphingobium sp. CF614]SFF77859.1 hypothetical protein SAMN05518801_101453 [Novosphingobium sp. CF614]
MDATPNSTGDPGDAGGDPPRFGARPLGPDPASALGMKWSALHDAASAVAAMAGTECAAISSDIRNFPATVRNAEGWRRTLVEQGIEDLSAIMQPAVSALLAALAHGADPRPAALALWREFVAARDALLGLAPCGAGGPHRTA